MRDLGNLHHIRPPHQGPDHPGHIGVPTSVPVPDLHNMDINLKSPGRIIVEEQQFSPVVMKGEHGAGPKTMILHIKKGIPSPVVVEVKGIVTLSEAVQVPAVPKIEILQLVQAPGDSVLRHPIYGRDLQAGKRAWEDVEVNKEVEVVDESLD